MKNQSVAKKKELQMFIQTEATPNPATLKFLPGKDVLPGNPREFTDPSHGQGSPLVRNLFSIDGVKGVFLGADFITVTKDDTDWQVLKPAILGMIMEHFVSGVALFDEAAAAQLPDAADSEFFDEEDAQIVDMIKQLLDERVRPAVAMDGGDITFKGFRSGVVYLNMQGACAGCPSSTATLKHGIENLLRHFVPDVTEVQQI